MFSFEEKMFSSVSASLSLQNREVHRAVVSRLCPHEMNRVILSIVIIARNEEALIGNCLDSVLQAAEPFPNAEIVLVDSASGDRTIEIARQFPIRILSLPPSRYLSPSAGRYVGFHHTTGEAVFFIDGDCTVDPGWLSRAVPFLLSDMSVAGVSGYEDEKYDDEAGPPLVQNVMRRPDHVTELKRLRGIGLYRRQALEVAGAFNPHLVCGEEGELALRLRQRRYRLVHLPYYMSCHWRGVRKPLSKVRRDYQLGRHRGLGVTLRYAWQAGTFWSYLFRDCWYVPVFVVALALGAGGGLVTLLSGNVGFLWGWLGLLLTVVFAISVRKRSPLGFVYVILQQALCLTGMIRGFVGADIRPLDAYSLKAMEVRVNDMAETQRVHA